MYLKLIENIPHTYCCSEQPSSYHMLTERHLQAMWLEQKYFKNITTIDGHLIEVISPGIWNSEAGPDFLKAHIRINGAEIFGDVEIHFSDESWFEHGHNTDPRYNQVVLHVGYWVPKKQLSIRTSKGFPIACTHLKQFLTIPESRLLKLIDLDLYPYHRFSGSGRCSSEVFSRLDVKETVDLFSSAALWRLRQKWQYLENMLDEKQNVLIGGIASALGYKHNSTSFIELYRILSNETNSDEHSLFMEALAICGFFQPIYRKRWFFSTYYQKLASQYDSLDKPRPHITLKLDHIRPSNHPIRRLAYMAALVAQKDKLHSLPQSIENLWYNHEDKKDWKQLQQQLFNIIPHFDTPYWLRHYAFEHEEQSKNISWIGNELKKEIVINVILPFLFHSIHKRENGDEIASFSNFFAALSATKAKKTAYLTHRFFGDDKKSNLMSYAHIQQGAYQVHKDFCIHYEASCEGCPFVNRVKNLP